MSKAQRATIDALMRQAPFDGSLPPEQLRKDFENQMTSGPAPAGVRVTPSVLGGRPALTIEPEGTPADGTIVYFHGGGWVFGSPATALQLTAALVRRTGVRAVSVDYRLAPEHPFPAAVEDGLAAYRDLLDQGVPAERIVLAGESAGGGLSVTTLLAAREAGVPMPAAAVALSPVLDTTLSGDSMTTKHDADPLFTRAELATAFAHYLAGQDPHQPLLSPALHADPTGLPPLLLQAGSNEVLLDDSTRFAALAAAAGVDVQLDVTADVPHVFQTFEGLLDEAAAALDRAARFITDALARS
ncbi:alpha/beta hydrolase [Streptomyces sp. NBC_00335]|uniref:alpha/beta hydrolase n=1 Tax=unclassified Streptomyces TaxID=2593676 RepID=UPI00224F3D11|nr:MULTISPECIES: alpha/beta hydrolase [unclassified Streptomyces]MCX5403797.1 alpha/beta hydrolase [Streptomyces sp. NBC_00086]